MAADAGLSGYCEKCKRTMSATQFYTSNNLEKYPNGGKLNMCKKCITMHVDNWNPETYLWILQEVDVPYVPEQWNSLLQRYGRDRSRVTGMTILGRYLAIMRVKQFRDYRWKDTDYLQQITNNKIEQTMKKSGYSAAQIAETIERGTVPIPEGELAPPPVEEPSPHMATGKEDYFAEQQGITEDELDEELDLTEKERNALRLKWGLTYRPSEWVRLEQMYNDFLQSYDINTAGDLDTLKLVCKTSLKANQLLDLGDIEAAQKVTKMYDSLMKSGKWTAAQNKSTEAGAVDSVGELVTMCEEQGFIPRYYTNGPQDHVDRVIEDLKRYTFELLKNESGLSEMVEEAVRQMNEESKKIEAAGAAAVEQSPMTEEERLFQYNTTEKTLETSDYLDFVDYEEELRDQDTAYLRREVEK